ERDPGQDRRGPVDVAPGWPPALAVAAAMLLAVLARLPFLHTPLTADEGGYAEVARLWSHGAVLYHGAWVDRPQGLLMIFRAMLHVDGGSAEALRALAAVAGALAVAVTMVVTGRLAGRIPATIAGLAMATVGAAPFIESFTLSGELLASFFAVASLLAFVLYLERSAPGWLIAAGLLTGCAVLVKQSAFDAGAAATPGRDRAGGGARRGGVRARRHRRRDRAELSRLVVRDGHLPRPGRLH